MLYIDVYNFPFSLAIFPPGASTAAKKKDLLLEFPLPRFLLLLLLWEVFLYLHMELGMGWELLLLLLLLRYARLGLTFSPTNIISPFLVTHSYKLPHTPAFKLSKYVRIIDFPPRRVVIALSKLEAGSIPPLSRWAKMDGSFFIHCASLSDPVIIYRESF